MGLVGMGLAPILKGQMMMTAPRIEIEGMIEDGYRAALLVLSGLIDERRAWAVVNADDLLASGYAAADTETCWIIASAARRCARAGCRMPERAAV